MRKLLFLLFSFFVPFLVFAQSENFLERDLEFGMRGRDVRLLQEWLAKDKEIYPEGFINGYFGKLTEKAVQRYQKKYGIVKTGSPSTTGYGRVGSITRASLNSFFGEKIFGISFIQGREKKAIFLEGGYLEIKDSPLLSFQNDDEFTIEILLKPEKFTKRKQMILGKGFWQGSFNYGIGVAQQGRVFTRHLEGDIFAEKTYLKEKEWQHLVVTFKKDKIIFYLNGKLIEEKSNLGFHRSPNNLPLLIGISKENETFNLAENFLGAIEEIKIYKGLFGAEKEKFFSLNFNEDLMNQISLNLRVPAINDFSFLFPPPPPEYEKDLGDKEKDEKNEEKKEEIVVDLKVNDSDGPVSVEYNQEILLSWITRGANFCQASGDWQGEKPLEGKETRGPLISSKKYILTCKNEKKKVSDSVIVNIVPVSGGFGFSSSSPSTCQEEYPSGTQTYTVTSYNIPKITQIVLDHLNLAYGENQVVLVSIHDSNNNPITLVSGTAFTDTKQTNFSLSLVEGTETNGSWQGSWQLLDKICENFQLKILAQSESGRSEVVLSFK